ncbi:MAG: hypothetical protein KF805_11290 [Phycisphaeraceae bacterium]|nr:hypothetical protein [Phycisphaeraceae bacterium]
MSAMNLCLAGLGLCALSAPCASAAVTFTSRLSTATASVFNVAPVDEYNESGSYNQLGASTITLPHGFSHSSTVTNAGVSGTWNGYKERTGVSNVYTERTSTLDALFTVGAGGIKATIRLNGSAHNINSDPGANPFGQNAYFIITSVATNAVMFDSFVWGTQNIIPQDDWSQVSWNNVIQQVTLAAGDYRLQVRADGDIQRHAGPGGGFLGESSLTANMTFSAVPAPASLALGAGAMLIGARRKR